MLRLSLLLGVAIYAGLVITSEQLPDRPAEVGRAALAVDVTAPTLSDRSDVLVTSDDRRLRIVAVIDPADLDADMGAIPRFSTAPDETLVASASVGSPELPLVAVTGTQVNLRAGPSTVDAVLGALVQGEQAELIAATGNGWVQIRALSTGTVGYMADRFVAPVN